MLTARPVSVQIMACGTPLAIARASAAPRLDPARDREHRDEHPDAGREIAVDHLDPGLAVRYRAAGQRGLRGVDVDTRAERARVAVAARPVGAAEA